MLFSVFFFKPFSFKIELLVLKWLEIVKSMFYCLTYYRIFSSFWTWLNTFVNEIMQFPLYFGFCELFVNFTLIKLLKLLKKLSISPIEVSFCYIYLVDLLLECLFSSVSSVDYAEIKGLVLFYSLCEFFFFLIFVKILYIKKKKVLLWSKYWSYFNFFKKNYFYLFYICLIFSSLFS